MQGAASLDAGEAAQRRAAKAGFGRVARRGASAVVRNTPGMKSYPRGAPAPADKELWIDEGPVKDRRAGGSAPRPSFRPDRRFARWIVTIARSSNLTTV